MKYLFVLVLNLSLFNNHAQTGIIYNDFIDGRSIQEDDGSITSFAINENGLYFIKSIGNTVVESFKTNHSELDSLDVLSNVIKLNGNNYIIHAYDNNFENSFFIKFNSTTKLTKVLKISSLHTWNRPLTSIVFNLSNSLIYTQTYDNSHPSFLALDTNLNIIWNKQYSSGGSSLGQPWGNNIILNSDNLTSFLNSGSAVSMVKFDFNGNMVSQAQILSDPALDVLTSAFSCANGDYFITGNVGYKSAFARCDSLGNLKYLKFVDFSTRPSSYKYICKRAYELPNNNILLFCVTDFVQKNHHVIEVDSSGNLIKGYCLSNEWESDFIYQFNTNGTNLMTAGLRGNGVDLTHNYIDNPRFYTFESPNPNELLTCINDTISSIVVSPCSWTNDPLQVISYSDQSLISNTFNTTLNNNVTVNYDNCIPGYASVEDNNTKYQLLLYPNPVSDKLYISSSFMPSKVQIIDLSGKSIDCNIKYGNSEITADVSAIPPGMYFLVFQFKDSFQTRKFIRH